MLLAVLRWPMWDVQWLVDGEIEPRENISVVQFLNFFFNFFLSDYVAVKFNMLYLILHVMLSTWPNRQKTIFHRINIFPPTQLKPFTIKYTYGRFSHMLKYPVYTHFRLIQGATQTTSWIVNLNSLAWKTCNTELDAESKY